MQYKITYSDSLAHHGIKGMHWGVRRFQNADGTYTDAGKKRYAVYDEPGHEFLSQEKPMTSKELRSYQNKKKIENLGKAVALGAVIGVGGYVAINSGAAESMIELGKRQLTRNKNIPSVDEETVNKRPSTATQAVYEANKRATAQRKAQAKVSRVDPIQNGSSKANERAQKIASSLQDLGRSTIRTGAKVTRSAVSAAGKASKNAASAAGKSASEAVRRAIRNKATAGIDEDDPSTWLRAFTNAADAVNAGRRYARAAKAVKNKDAVRAAAEVAPDLTDAANAMIDQGRKQLDDFRQRRGIKR